MNDNAHQSHSIFENKRVHGAVVLVFLMLAVFLAVKTVSDIKAYRFIGGGVPISNIITVSGEGEVFAVPDIANFTFSVEEEKLTVAEAQEAATKKINSALAYLRENGIEERDIKTINYNVFPRYEYTREVCITFPCPTGKRELHGFDVNQTISVKVRDTEIAGKLLAGIGEIGVTRVSGLNFTIDDEDELIEEARRKAIDEAKEKAKQLARDLDVTLVRIVSFSENGRPFPGARFELAFTEQAIGIDGGVPEIPVGENKIVSRVSITYEIR